MLGWTNLIRIHPLPQLATEHPSPCDGRHISPTVAAITSLALGLAGQQGAPPGPVSGGRRAHKTSPLDVKFNGDPQQVWSYMVEYGPEIPTGGAKVRCVTMALEGPAAQWMVILHNDNASELRNFNRFMTVLHKLFEDPLVDHKARDCIKPSCKERGWWRSTPKNFASWCAN